jgi:Fe-S-cluster containining protein
MQAELSYDLTRESSFSYSCNRCKKCCHDKRIRVSPYEVLRLARNLGLTTKEFISQFTEEGGTILRFRSEDGGCSLLGEEGCTVHADRPGACRIYPLGGFFQLDGEETFALVTPHPESLGVYGSAATFKPSDTVASFLEAQGLAPYHRANHRYVELLTRLLPFVTQHIMNRVETETTPDTSCSELEIEEWYDVDTVVANYCTKQDIPVPADIETQVELHIRAMEEWAQGVRNSKQ